MQGKDKKLPKRGEVELLVGGPPCTGLSKMGHQTDGDCISFKVLFKMIFYCILSAFHLHCFILSYFRYRIH